MPQITVDYSDNLADGFDRPAFARDLHSAVVEIAAAKPPACKTRFRRTEDPVVGPDTGTPAAWSPRLKARTAPDIRGSNGVIVTEARRASSSTACR